MTILAFDFGERRIGVAVGERSPRSANPLATIPAQGGRPNWPRIERLVHEWRPETIVVGMPVNMDGSRHALADRVERFARQLKERFRVPVEFSDERLSSIEAAGREDEPRHSVDAVAARVILETWLECGAVTPYAN